MFDDHANVQFPQLDIAWMTLVSHGSYQFKNVDSYVTDITSREVLEMLQNQGGNIDWQTYDVLNCSFPTQKQVHIYDQVGMPQNWNPQLFGQWFSRRLVCISIPGRHSANTTHKVIIEFIPENEQIPAGFKNPYGFNGCLERIVGYGCLNTCMVGHRQAGCCSHVACALVFLGIYAFDQNGFKTKYKPLHMVDPGQPSSLNVEMYHQ